MKPRQKVQSVFDLVDLLCVQGRGCKRVVAGKPVPMNIFAQQHRRPAPRPTYTQTTHHWVSSIFYRKIVAVGRKRMY